MVIAARLWEYTEKLLIVYLKKINFMGYELYLKEKKTEMSSVPRSPFSTLAFWKLRIYMCVDGATVEVMLTLSLSWTGQLLAPKFTGACVLGDHRSLDRMRASESAKCVHRHCSSFLPHPPAVPLTSSVVITSLELQKVKGVANISHGKLYFVGMYPCQNPDFNIVRYSSVTTEVPGWSVDETLQTCFERQF